MIFLQHSKNNIDPERFASLPDQTLNLKTYRDYAQAVCKVPKGFCKLFVTEKFATMAINFRRAVKRQITAHADYDKAQSEAIVFWLSKLSLADWVGLARSGWIDQAARDMDAGTFAKKYLAGDGQGLFEAIQIGIGEDGSVPSCCK